MHQGDADALRHLVMHNNPKPILKGYCALVNHIPNLQFTPKTYKRKCRLGENCYPMIHKYYLFIFNNFNLCRFCAPNMDNFSKCKDSKPMSPTAL